MQTVGVPTEVKTADTRKGKQEQQMHNNENRKCTITMTTRKCKVKERGKQEETTLKRDET